MESQSNCVNNTQYDVTANDYNNNKDKKINADNGSYRMAGPVLFQMSGSPTTSSSVDDFYGGQWRMEMGGAQDDLASVFLDLQELAGMENQCSIGKGSGAGGRGDDVPKSARGRPRINGGLTEGIDESKKAMMNMDKLDELRIVDPKRAKRILANRQSAARSKERKAHYLVELERRVRSLQVETTDLAAQLRIYQRDTTGLTTENTELKIRLQVMQQQAQFHGAQNEALKHEVERLKVAMGETKMLMESYSSGGARKAMHSPMAPLSTQNYSPQPSPLTMQTMSYSLEASSPTSRNNSLFSFPNQLVPMISSLPPLHNSLSCFHRPVPEQNDSLVQLQNFETIINNNVGSSSGVEKTEGDSTTQLLIP